MSSSKSVMHFFLLFLLSFILPFIAQATVPTSGQFKFVNDGEFGPFVVEYFGNYRMLSIASSPFQLGFYNTTPNAFTLALRMGTTRSESLMRWVWEANRGNPVRENATLSLGKDGNLVLAEANGDIAWQTNTANKGVTGFKLLPNGNMVLHDSKGKFIWQSFDFPTDTLLVGQSLKVNGPTKLVSRASEKVNANGSYSLVLTPKNLALYYKSPNSPRLNVYYSNSIWVGSNAQPLESVTLASTQDSSGFGYELSLNLPKGGSFGLGTTKFNSTLTYMRLGVDGNLRLFSFFDKLDIGGWEETFTLFSRESSFISECQLPQRCGDFGVCEDNQCVACPSPSGLLGWSKNCKPKMVNSCGVKSFHYYKVEGVDHYMSKFNVGQGPIKEIDCGKKCSNDCKCVGYFYHSENSMCWIAYDLGTLSKVDNSGHFGYVKVPA